MKKLFLLFLIPTLLAALPAMAADPATSAPVEEQSSKTNITIGISFHQADCIAATLNAARKTRVASDIYVYVEGTVEYNPYFVSVNPDTVTPEEFSGMLYLPAGSVSNRTIVVPNTGLVSKVNITRAEIVMPAAAQDDTYIYTLSY